MAMKQWLPEGGSVQIAAEFRHEVQGAHTEILSIGSRPSIGARRATPGGRVRPPPKKKRGVCGGVAARAQSGLSTISTLTAPRPTNLRTRRRRRRQLRSPSL
eukprot:3443862-Pleurochrysis_carterae.AAC.1